MDKTEIFLSGTASYAGRIFRVDSDKVRLPDGTTAQRDVVKCSNAAACVPFIGKDVILVKQFRYAVGREILEIPAGKIEGCESPKECITRELAEEIGFSVASKDDLTLLTRMFPSPGYTNETIYLYAAFDLTEQSAPPDPGENIEIVRMPFSEALVMVGTDSIVDAKTQLGLLLATYFFNHRYGTDY